MASDDGPVLGDATSQHVSMSEQAYRTLKERILSGQLAGNTFISEGEIASEMNISRTPVREAFLRLQAEGWMQLFPKRGAMILPAPAGESEAVLEARKLLETWAVRTIGLTPAVVTALAARLDAIIGDQESSLENEDASGFARADALFHQTIVRAAGNPIVTNFFETLEDRQRRMTATSIWGHDDLVRKTIADHKRLAATVEAGDDVNFLRELTEHLETAYLLSVH